MNNLAYFGRLLRTAGLPIGTGRILQAIRAVRQIDIGNRVDFYWALHAVFVSHPRHRFIFDQAFQVYWKNPRILERSIAALLPEVRVPADEQHAKELARRLSDSLYPPHNIDEHFNELPPDFEFQASMTFSDQERLRQVDFASMSIDEMQQAKQIVTQLGLAFRNLPTRRFRPHESGEKLDMKKTLSASFKGPADVISLVRKKRRLQPPPVVLICDISGSMSEYSRVILHFAHTLMLSQIPVFCFVFGTRLTNITRPLKIRDVDCALDEVAQVVVDWHGGTRIGDCLRTFNHTWIRRLPLHRASVLLVTDGLDRSKSVHLDAPVQLLQRSCKELLWLNPLLRYSEFEPKVSGIRAILPYVDAFLPIHNLDSLQSLTEMLSRRVTMARDCRDNRAFWRQKLADASPYVAPVPGG